MRVALAAVLFAEPDILLLDEPTNYLDLEGTLWLEDHIARYPRTVIVISHDRDLLDNAVDSILHLDRGKLTFYRGDYTSFERQRRERQALDLEPRQEAGRPAQAAHRFRRALPRQGHQGAPGAVAPQAARQAASRSPRASRTMCARSRSPPPTKPLSPPIIALDDVDVGYEPGEPVLRRLTLRVDADDRIALLGANGNGKSTLTKLSAGRLAPIAGTHDAGRQAQGRLFRPASARRTRSRRQRL